MGSLFSHQNNGGENLKVGYKIWLENNGKAFGGGPCELLKRVQETGSLNQAAARMGMSYSKAWRIIRNAEKKLGFLLLKRTIGGRAGGGSKITPEAQEFLIVRYELFEKEVRAAIERIYESHFGDRWSGGGH